MIEQAHVRPAPPPIPCVWDGDTFRPLPAYLRVATSCYGAGEINAMAPVEDRSAKSHRHFFATVREAWLNLPEQLTARFPSPDHLRKFALIKAGYRDERSIVCGSKAEALRIASFVKPMDDFAVVTVSAAVVTVYTAKSQAERAMGKKVFQASKDGVLGVLAEIVGVEVGILQQQAAA